MVNVLQDVGMDQTVRLAFRYSRALAATPGTRTKRVGLLCFAALFV